MLPSLMWHSEPPCGRRAPPNTDKECAASSGLTHTRHEGAPLDRLIAAGRDTLGSARTVSCFRSQFALRSRLRRQARCRDVEPCFQTYILKAIGLKGRSDYYFGEGLCRRSASKRSHSFACSSEKTRSDRRSILSLRRIAVCATINMTVRVSKRWPAGES